MRVSSRSAETSPMSFGNRSDRRSLTQGLCIAPGRGEKMFQPGKRAPMIETATSAIPSPAAARADGAAKRLHRAVRRNPLLMPSGMSEYVFSRLFRSLVYAQIWEDPEVDMAALRIAPGNSIVTIASAGATHFPTSSPIRPVSRRSTSIPRMWPSTA